ncbi:protein kinase [Paenibacillus chitinolyticus]|uniref:protein kinase domain-containing protein n=1 Tax=Paenibacillus chitinolyticus TaxID=79263 RepID=UPI002DB6E4A1|nr:protein kinase [Paenibacillus chitinolyticus]MEC0248685.1 protein kinase [Paenibacillus chitinolyticus]
MNSLQQLVHAFQSEPGFNQLFSLFREKYRSYESIGPSSKVILTNPTEYERKVLKGFFGESFKDEETITISTAMLQKAIKNTKYRDAFASHSINELVEMYYAGSLTSKKQDRISFEQRKELFFQSFISTCDSGSPFYQFLMFVQDHSSASRIHLMYKSDPDMLRSLLEFIEEFFHCLPLDKDVFLPMLALKLTGDSQALNPKTDKGKMMQYALQVLNHLNKGTDILSKLSNEQFEELLLGYQILFCPDSAMISNRLSRFKKVNNDQENEDCKYNLIALKKIGRGSFAEVYRVFDPELQVEKACKVLFDRSHFLQEFGKEGEEYLLRFKREVKFIQKEISDSNIIKIDKIQLDYSPFWFTMPLADDSLEEWLKKNPDLTEEIRVHLFSQILCGIKCIHDRKITHRDLAPNNILMFKDDNGNLTIKIADFGLAKDHHSTSILTRASASNYGRWDFTAPEQKDSLKNADHLSDIYSLGALFYYLLSGESPGQRFVSPINKYQPVVAKAMHDERCMRYQTIDEFIAEIEQLKQRNFQGDICSFHSLTKYKYNLFSTDVSYVLNCVTTARSEFPEQVYENFVRPFLSIPPEILEECSKYEAVMIPFMQIAGENLKVLYQNTASCSDTEWNQVSVLALGVFRGAQNIGLQVAAVNIILETALIVNSSVAQLLVGEIMQSLASNSKIAVHLAQILNKNFQSYHETLIQILQGKLYPQEIRDTLNDY